jgi:hypothetical protein
MHRFTLIQRNALGSHKRNPDTDSMTQCPKKSPCSARGDVTQFMSL